MHLSPPLAKTTWQMKVFSVGRQVAPGSSFHYLARSVSCVENGRAGTQCFGLGVRCDPFGFAIKLPGIDGSACKPAAPDSMPRPAAVRPWPMSWLWAARPAANP